MKNVSEKLYRHLCESPEQIALYLLKSNQPTEILTYQDLILKSANYAHALNQKGITQNEVVVLILNHGINLVTSFWGAILNGSIPAIMPFLSEKLSPEHYRASLSSLLEITEPSAVITYPQFLNEVEQSVKGTKVRSVLVSDEIEMRSDSESIFDSGNYYGFKCSREDIVLLQHSSGTTGLQKGVALSHRAVFNQLDNYATSIKLNEDDIVVSWLPLYHDMGLIAGFVMPILLRIPLVLLSPFDWVRAPQRLLQAISKYKGTLCWLPNFEYNFCTQRIRSRDLENVNLYSLRALINCSEPMYWNSHSMFLERFAPYGFQESALATSYAMAENVFAVTQGGISDPITIDYIDTHAYSTQQIAKPFHDPESINTSQNQEELLNKKQVTKMLSAGRTIEGTKIRIIDPTGKDLPDRHIGEIVLKGNCMLSGYYNRPDLTENAFLDGWYLTGDLGYIADGELYVTGRKKDLIIVGGKNVYPQDLERLANGVDGVHPGRVVAFGVFNERSGTEDVVIVAELDDKDANDGSNDGKINTSESPRIANEIRQKVTQGSDIALRYVHTVSRNWLIKTSSGKISRNANRDKYLREIAP